MDDTHTYIRMDCQWGNPVSAPGTLGGNGPWTKSLFEPTFDVALGLRVLCDLNTKTKEKAEVTYSLRKNIKVVL